MGGPLKSWAKVAHERGEAAMEAVDEALGDDVSPGEIDAHEMPTVMVRLADWLSATRTAKAAKAVADAAEYGVDVGGAYWRKLNEDYVAYADEVA